MSNGAEWGYDNADGGSFEDRQLVIISRADDGWRVHESARHSVGPFATQRAAEEWAWAHSYRWTETKDEMEEWF